MRLQGRDPGLQGVRGDLHAVRRPGVPADQQPADLPRFQAVVVEQLGEHPPVAGVAHRVERRQPGHAVVGHVQSRDELELPRPGEHDVGPVLADPPRDVPPQRQPVLEHAVGVIQELHVGDADRRGPGDLLAGADLARAVRRRRVHAGLPAGEHQVGDVDTAGGPHGDRGRGAVLDVVGVGDDAQHAAELGVRQCRQQIGHARDATRGPARSGRRRARRREEHEPHQLDPVRPRVPAGRHAPSCHTRTVPTAIRATSSTAQPYTPALTAGNAMLDAPSPTASSRGRAKHDDSSTGSVCPRCRFGPDGVDHPAGGQPEPGGRDGVPDGQPVRQRGPAQLPARGQQLGPGGGVDRAVDSPAAEQGRVRGVDDDVDVLRGDVPEDGLDQHPAIIAASTARHG